MGFQESVTGMEMGPMDVFQRGSTFIPAEVKIGQLGVISLTLQSWRQSIWKEVRRRSQ